MGLIGTLKVVCRGTASRPDGLSFELLSGLGYGSSPGTDHEGLRARHSCGFLDKGVLLPTDEAGLCPCEGCA